MILTQQARRAIILALFNQKGGVGKTTTASALAVNFAEWGLQTLLVDNDPQRNLTAQLDIDIAKILHTVGSLYVAKSSKESIAVPTSIENLDIIPASLDDAIVELLLSAKNGSDVFLRNSLRTTYSKDYDVIIIDTHPSLGKFVTNAINAADYILAPVDGTWGLEAVDTIINLIAESNEIYEGEHLVELAGVFLTMVADNTKNSRAIKNESGKRFADKFFETTIRRSVKVQESATHRKPLPVYAPKSDVAQDYQALANEVALRIGLKIPAIA